MKRPWQVVVCGTKFGRVYAAALAKGIDDLQLAGIIARGSQRSVDCARFHGVPLYESIDDLPSSVDAACVIVGAGIAGGKGTEIATALLGRGVAVLQEHPMHHDELARVASVAVRNRTVHQLCTLYPYTENIGRFVRAARALRNVQPLLYADITCAVQFKLSAFDILCRILDRVRPWSFESLPFSPASNAPQSPWRSIQGVLGGLPIVIRLQNQLHATDPDNYSHAMHRITLGTASGSLVLTDTNGPILWFPRPHIPLSIQQAEEPEACIDPALDLAACTVVHAGSGDWRDVIGRQWRDAARRAVALVRRRVEGEQEPYDSQYYLALTRVLHDFDKTVGPPELIRDPPVVPLDPGALIEAARLGPI
ncbi:MAG: Gfo/Idh/MocA family oxidoreductase [Pseudomonadota bacterium]